MVIPIQFYMVLFSANPFSGGEPFRRGQVSDDRMVKSGMPVTISPLIILNEGTIYYNFIKIFNAVATPVRTRAGTGEGSEVIKGKICGAVVATITDKSFFAL